MLRTRVIPLLTISNGALVKTVKFSKATYLGDPLNAVRIFNELEVDEVVVTDIEASKDGKSPDFKLIEEVASQCFMPLTYGGAIRSMEDFKRAFSAGIEKVAINSSLFSNPTLVREASSKYGAQSIVASVDFEKTLFGKYKVRAKRFSPEFEEAKSRPELIAPLLQKLGVGEILLNSVERDGTMQGYDLDLVRAVASATRLPVIACGGAGKCSDFALAVQAGASAVAAGSLFVFSGPERGVLINFPTPAELREVLPK